MEDVELPINFQFKNRLSPYTVVVREYLFGQWRIQLCKGQGNVDIEELPIVREACTYYRLTAIKAKDALLASPDPEAVMESWARRDNCDHRGGRIRLDNEEV